MSEPKPLVVIVEDEKELASLLSQRLEESGMMTMVCHSAEHAFRFLNRNFANLLLLDLGLPDKDGFSLLEQLKGKGVEVPTIFLTGHTSEMDIVRGLTLGGDDYITKPFRYPELIARIQAVLRRAETHQDNKVTRNASLMEEPFEFCGATIVPERLEASFPNGTTTKIGRKDLGILSCLHNHQGAVLSRKSLIHSVWGVHADVRSRSLDQYIVKIRDNFSKNGCDLSAFSTVHGIGYLYDPEKAADTSKS